MTRSDNIEEHRKGVLLPHLPLTFRHVAQILRHLGVRYLWIDFLCILQDSKDDWERGFVKMRDVYKHSFLAIAARAARNAEDGCFITRNQDVLTC